MLIAVVAVAPLLLLAPIVAPVALVVLVTGILSLSRRTRTWLRFRSRRSAVITTWIAGAALLISGSISAGIAANMENTPTVEVAPALVSSAPDDRAFEPLASPTPTPTPSPTPVKTTREEVVTEPIPFSETQVDDETLASGKSQVRTPGKAGEKSITYLVHLVDGDEVSRKVVDESVMREPVTQVIVNGTYVEPPAAPPAQNCDPNYADACVPVASDVDCAGGSGNGPAYFSGVARVVGIDIYDLDRDGDGYACE